MLVAKRREADDRRPAPFQQIQGIGEVAVECLVVRDGYGEFAAPAARAPKPGRIRRGHFALGCQVEDFGGREKSLAGIKEVLAETRKATVKYLDSLSDQDLEMPVKFPTDWWEGLGLAELPLHEVFRNVAMHEWYHTGQLVSYLWSRGDDPYSW